MRIKSVSGRTCVEWFARTRLGIGGSASEGKLGERRERHTPLRAVCRQAESLSHKLGALDDEDGFVVDAVGFAGLAVEVVLF
jgi:hypothetical protein